MACKNCKDNEQIPQHVKDDFAYVCMNRTIGRLIAIVIVCICLLFASNVAWLYAWCQYDYSSDEIVVEQDAKDGGANGLKRAEIPKVLRNVRNSFVLISEV